MDEEFNQQKLAGRSFKVQQGRRRFNKNLSSNAALLSQQREIESPAQISQTISLQLPFLHCRDPEQHPEMKRVPDPKVTTVLPNLSPLATFLCSAEPRWGRFLKYCVSHLEDPSLSLQNFLEVLLRDVCSS